MRKTRRKIKRRNRKKPKIKRKSRWARHLDSVPTNKWTKLTTYCLIIFEFVFVVWWLQELLLTWTEILMKLRNLRYFMFGGL